MEAFFRKKSIKNKGTIIAIKCGAKWTVDTGQLQLRETYIPQYQKAATTKYKHTSRPSLQCISKQRKKHLLPIPCNPVFCLQVQTKSNNI